MKVTLAMVISIDGRITDGDNPGTMAWASPEDQDVFQQHRDTHDCIVMGRATYAAVRPILQPTASKPRVVLTRSPQRFAQEVAPGLEFSAQDPAELLDRLERQGFRKVLLVGGSETNPRFLDAGLVDELFVTVEPLLFGSGLPFTQPLQQTRSFHLLSSQRLNSRGTLLLHYSAN